MFNRYSSFDCSHIISKSRFFFVIMFVRSKSSISFLVFPFSPQSENEFQQLVGRLNAGRPQCPVGLNTLVLPTRGSLNLRDRQPYVYIPCGHVHGNHGWGQADTNTRKCPLCLAVSFSLLSFFFF